MERWARRIEMIKQSMAEEDLFAAGQLTCWRRWEWGFGPLHKMAASEVSADPIKAALRAWQKLERSGARVPDSAYKQTDPMQMASLKRIRLRAFDFQKVGDLA